MGHGGKRAGAGRPRKIERDPDRQLIGQLCEMRHIEEKQRRRGEETRPHSVKVMDRLSQKLRRIGLKNVPAWEMQKLRDELNRSLRKGDLRYYRRPKGCRGAIITIVAKETGCPKRMVQRCWVEYRAAGEQWLDEAAPWSALPKK